MKEYKEGWGLTIVVLFTLLFIIWGIIQIVNDQEAQEPILDCLNKTAETYCLNNNCSVLDVTLGFKFDHKQPYFLIIKTNSREGEKELFFTKEEVALCGGDYYE